MTALPICSVDGCSKAASTRGLCSSHYSRLLRHGSPLGGSFPRATKGTFLGKKCSEEGCTNPAKTRGLCHKHYATWMRHSTGRPKCKVDGCEKNVMGHGYCNNHYQRWVKYGDPLAGRVAAGVPMKWLTKFLSEKSWLPDECAVWPFAKNGAGYGVLRIKTHRNRIVSNYVCSLHYGPAPDGAECAHSCNNPSCINPLHLRWATRKENCHDIADSGHAHRGNEHHFSKLSAEDVNYIRATAETMTNKSLASKFGISSAYVSRIRSKKTWRWLD